MRKTRIAELDVVLFGGSDREGGGTGPMCVLLHGYGAPGGDLVPLAREIVAPRELRFAFPAAPTLLMDSSDGAEAPRAWWHIDMLELQRAAQLQQYEALMQHVPEGLAEARAKIEELISALESEHGVTRDKLVLGGFSQGAMLATDVVLRAARQSAALVILSGALVARDEWLPLMPARRGLPVLQSHGRSDPILPFALGQALQRALTAAGLPPEFHAWNGGHGIPGGVVDALGPFLKRVTS
jgi:phospholipase/carboxylesterase